MAELAPALPLAAAAVAYAAGRRRTTGCRGDVSGGPRGGAREPRRAWCFAGGLAVVAVAVLPPLANRAGGSLTAHMAQHVLLLSVAAPVLVAGAPVRTMLALLPAGVRRAHEWVESSRLGPVWTAWAAGALVTQTAVMWLWHVPAVYELGRAHEAVHAAEHASFLGAACLFWWAIGTSPDQPRGAAVPFAFAGAVPGTALGAALTLAARAWYPAYPSLEDQQLAGVAMWGFAGFAYVIAAAVLFAVWLAAADRASPPRPVPAAATVQL